MEDDQKRSLFYQRMKQAQEQQNSNSNISNSSNASSGIDASYLGNRSYIVTGNDAENIHNQNLALLSRMSLTEIEDNRQKLLEIISPTHLNFLRKKRELRITQEGNNNNLVESFTNMHIERPLPSAVENLINNGLHMDVYESEKMKWLQDIPQLEKTLPSNVYEARFNFDGDLMPYTTASDEIYNNGLYHHGEEPHRPGYSVQELFLLTRSSFLAQRVMSLNALAAILEKGHILSEYLETPLVKNLLDAGLFLILRFSLDEPQRPMYVAALRAMTALLWNPIDMHFVRNVEGTFGFVEKPSLNVVIRELSEDDIKEMKDTDVIRIDLIKGALRTNILSRFKFLLHDSEIEITDLYRILKCLTRIICHSYESTAEVINDTFILSQLFYHFKNGVFQNTLYPARFIMLIRLISCRSMEFANIFITDWKILPFVFDVITSVETKAFISIQCVRLWHTFLQYGFLQDMVVQVSPIFPRLYQSIYIISNSNVEYANSLITLAIFLFFKFRSEITHLTDVIIEMVNHWLALLLNDDIPCEEKLFLKLLTNSVYLISVLPRATLPLEKLFTFLKNKTSLRYILTENSFILHANKKNFVEYFPSLCVPASILKSPNYLLFVHSILEIMMHRTDLSVCSALVIDILQSYTHDIMQCPNLYNVACLWPARSEILFIYNLIFVAERMRAPQLNNFILKNAFMLISIIPTIDKNLLPSLFAHILFNKQYYEIRDNTNNEYNVPLLFILEQLPSILQLYIEEFNLLNFPEINSFSLMTSPNNTEFFLPINWFYIPFLKYQGVENPVVSLQYFKLPLKWIYLIENVMPEVMNRMIPIVSRYCSLATLFFFQNIFLDLTDDLREILETMLFHNTELDFSLQIPGVTCFYDFYAELCIQYEKASYCDQVFGMFLLVPLQQKYSVEFKKLIWREQCTILRILTIPIHQLLVPLSNYLTPCESNRDLLMSYLISLGKGYVKKNVCPVLYEVAICHVSTFIREHGDEELAHVLKHMVETLGNQELRESIMNYQIPSTL